MTKIKTDQKFKTQPEKRLFLLFLSPQQFFPSPLRSLLAYFEANSWFSLVNLNPNLYNASSQLALDYSPIIYQWQLPDLSIESITITVIPQADSTHLLCWDLGTTKVAEYLIGSQSTPEVMDGLKKFLRAGLNMTARVAALTYESEPNRDIQLSLVDYINFSLSQLPILLSSRFSLTPKLTCLADDERALISTEENPVFVTNPLPLNLSVGDSYCSVWIDEEEENYYLLPNSLVLPGGNFPIRNYLSSDLKNINQNEIEQYAITQEQANEFIADELEQSWSSAMVYINDWISNQATTANIDRAQKFHFTGSEAEWAEIISECLEITESQIQQNPQLIGERVQELVSQFQNLLADDQSVSPEAKSSAQKTMVKIQNILNSHGIELGNTLEQLTTNVRRLDEIADSANSEQIDRLRHIVNLLADPKTDSSNWGAMLTTLISSYQQPEEDNQEIDYAKSAKDAVKQAAEKYPLPSISFEDLLKFE